ncbi:MAG: putative small lipoprotein YifL [Janthinobacterium sp.]
MILIVKSTLALYIVVAAVMLGGCGQPGALYLPKKPAPVAPATKAIATPAAAAPSTTSAPSATQ